MEKSFKLNSLKRFFLLPVTLLFFPLVSAETPISNGAITLPVFLFIAGLCCFLLLIGMAGRIPFFTIIGFLLVFVLGFTIQSGNVYLPTGETNAIYEYGNNFTDYHWDQYLEGDEPTFNPSDDAVFLFHKDTSKVYSAWDSGNYHFIGWFVMMAGLFATLFSVFAVFGGSDED